MTGKAGRHFPHHARSRQRGHHRVLVVIPRTRTLSAGVPHADAVSRDTPIAGRDVVAPAFDQALMSPVGLPHSARYRARYCFIKGRMERSGVVDAGIEGELVDHLRATTPLGRAEAARVIADVLAYYAEDLPTFVRRRHSELKRAGLRNQAIFESIIFELPTRRYAVLQLSARQVRRLIYG